MKASILHAIGGAILAIHAVGCTTTHGANEARPHAYAFNEPTLLATQRVFGIGNAVTVLGDACTSDEAAMASYAQWRTANLDTLHRMTKQLALHYQILAAPDQQQKRVAEIMHLKTQISLSDSALTEACASLPDTLTLPWMNLAHRYQSTLREVQDPNYLKPQKPKKIDDREEQTRSE